MLVIRRPLPARGEHQIAHVYLPPACNGDARTFPFRAARRRAARGQSARARVLGRRVSPATSAGSAWGEFAIARVRELYPEPTPKAVADPSDPRDAGHGTKRAAQAKKATGKPKPRRGDGQGNAGRRRAARRA